VLKSAVPVATADEIVAALTSSGRPVLDPRNGVTRPRINLLAAVEALLNATADDVPPTAMVALTSGSVWTRLRDVSLRIAASDASGVARMCLSEGGTGGASACGGSWLPFQSPTVFRLSDGDGLKTINVWLIDTRNNIMPAPAAVNVTLDTVAPAGPWIAINGGAMWTGSRAVTLTIGGSDANGFRSCVTRAPNGCDQLVLFRSNPPSFPYSFPPSAADGNQTLYLFVRDPAGNSNPQPAVASIRLDTQPPTLTAKIMGNGSPVATSPRVTLALAADDGAGGSGAVQVQVCDTPEPCGGWVALQPAMARDLPPGEGRRTVYVRARDAAGNEMRAPVEASIVIDTLPPANVRAFIAAMSPGTSSGLVTRGVKLAITASDFSGVKEYCLLNAASGPDGALAPPPAGGGAAACSPWLPFGGGTVDWTLANGPDGPRAVYVWLRDSVGNTMDAPATASVSLAAGGPFSGRIVVNGGKAGTATRTVNVTLATTGSGAGAVADMCVTEDAAATAVTCSPWVPFAPALTLQLSAGRGPKVLHAFFRDTAMRTTPEAATATIVYDTAPPQMAPRAVGLSGSVVAQTISLTWNPSGVDDGPEGSGVASYLLTYRKGSFPPPKCSTFGNAAAAVPLPARLATSAVVSGLQPYMGYRFRLCAVDAAGNTANGVVWGARTQRA
jgi:hypothetical protein